MIELNDTKARQREYIDRLSNLKVVNNCFSTNEISDIINEFTDIFPKTVYKYFPLKPLPDNPDSQDILQRLKYILNNHFWLSNPNKLNDSCECPIKIDPKLILNLAYKGLNVDANNKIIKANILVNAKKTLST